MYQKVKFYFIKYQQNMDVPIINTISRKINQSLTRKLYCEI